MSTFCTTAEAIMSTHLNNTFYDLKELIGIHSFVSAILTAILS